MLEKLYKDANEKMELILMNYHESLVKVRSGKASPNIVSGIHVDYYGSKTPIEQVAKIGVPEARLLVIDPWDKSIIKDIEKAISAANIGIHPSNDGRVIRLPVPALTEERRKEIVKELKSQTEHYRYSIRNVRRDFNSSLKQMEKKHDISEDVCKDGFDKLQEFTDKFIAEIDKSFKHKENEILTI